MPRVLVDPLNLGAVLVGMAALISAGYFVRVRDKSASTWYVLAFLVAWAAYTLSVAFWAFTHASIAADAAFYTSPAGITVLIVGALAGPMLTQAAYHFQSAPFRRESFVVLIASVTVVFAVIFWTIGNPTSAVGSGRWLVSFWSLWGVVVLLRKRSGGHGSEERARERAGMLAVAVFLLVVAVSEAFTGYNLILGSPRSTSLFIVGQIVQFTAVLAFPVVYVQYAPEPTTFQVKLVGFVLLIELAVFGVLAAFESPMDDHRQRFDPAMPPHSLMFIPAGDIAYQVDNVNLRYDDVLGDDLGLLDDTKGRIELPFGFPFAGDTLRAVVVDANGAIEPTGEAYPYVTFSLSFPTVDERPLIGGWYTDLNPGASGAVYADVRSDRLVVTWKDVPEWNYFLPHTVQVVLHASGQIDFNYVDLPFDRYVGAQGVLADPSFPKTTEAFDALVGTASAPNPFRSFDRRREFKEYLHGETMPFVWVVLGTVVFILLCAPPFFRFSLIRPLNRLLQGMRRVNDGDLQAELPVAVHDEFGYLAMNFNRMTQSLRTYSGEMESLVEDRTRELNASLESLKSAQDQLVQQEKMASLGQLTAGIAHEIKNPLNFINNFAELNAELADELEEAASKGGDLRDVIRSMRQNSNLIAEHGHRADSIVRSMMEHARHGGSEKEPVDVNTFVDEYLNLAYHGKRASTPDFNVTLRRSYGEDVGSVTIMRQDLGRVLLNLIGNAFDAVSEVAAGPVRLSPDDSATKHAGEYDPTVTVGTRREGNRVVIEVADNGPGVADDLKSKIFEPFFTTKPTGKGTGLGLSLSYDVVTGGHGGTMVLEDNDGGGARFVVTLPG